MTVRQNIVRVASAVACLAALWSLVIAILGGIDVRAAGVHVSSNDPLRPLLLASLAGTLSILVGDELIAAFMRRPDKWIEIHRRWRRFADALYQRPARVESPTRLRHVLIATAGLAVFAAIQLYPQLRHMDSVPDLGDPLFSIWRIGWVFHQLQGDPRGLFDANIFYPNPLTLTYSDSMLLPSLVAAPFLAAGIHPVVVYNGLFVASFVASGVAMFLLAAHVTGSRPAAFISALIFGFYPYRIEHYSHFELQMTMWMPLALLALHRFIETAKTRYALFAAAAVVAQMYSSMYYGVFFSLYAVPVAMVLLVAYLRAPVWKLLPGLALGAALAGACVFPLARAYNAAQGAKGDRDIGTVRSYSAEPSDYLEAHDRSAMYGRLIPSHHPERALFPGAMAPILSVVSLVPPVGPMTAAYGVALAFGWESSFGFKGWLYPLFYEWLSPIRGMRVAARFSLLVGMTLAVLAGIGAERLFARVRWPRARPLLLLALVVAIGFDLRPRLVLEPVWPAPPAIYGALPKTTSVVLAEYPVGFIGNLPYMYFSLWHWANMVNGYSGFSPRDFYTFAEKIDALPDASAIDALRTAGVTHVTINCALYEDGQQCRDLMAAVDSSSHFRRVAQTRWRGAPVALYELH